MVGHYSKGLKTEKALNDQAPFPMIICRSNISEETDGSKLKIFILIATKYYRLYRDYKSEHTIPANE